MKARRDTLVTAVAILAIAAALVPALLDTIETGRVYLFSREFLDDLPARFTGRGRLRFILQPTIATILGVRGGVADARAGSPPYLFGLLSSRRASRGARAERVGGHPEPACRGDHPGSRVPASPLRLGPPGRGTAGRPDLHRWAVRPVQGALEPRGELVPGEGGARHEGLAQASRRLRDQHLGLARRAEPEAPEARGPGHGPGTGVGRHRLPGIRRRLVHGRLGAEPGRDRDLDAKPGTARGLPPSPARLRARGQRRLALLRAPLRRRRAPRRPEGAGGRSTHARRARTAAHPRLRPQPRGAGPSLGRSASRVLRPGNRRRRQERSGVLRRDGREGVRAGPRSVLPGLARRAAAQRLPAGPPAGGDRDALGDRRAVRRRPLRHGDAHAERRSSSAPGELAPDPGRPTNTGRR